jgi:hypothetical protein
MRCVQAWFFDSAADGVSLRVFTCHSMQAFLVRSRDAAAQFVCKKRNVGSCSILLIPGPKAPKHYAVFGFLVFETFGAYLHEYA